MNKHEHRTFPKQLRNHQHTNKHSGNQFKKKNCKLVPYAKKKKNIEETETKQSQISESQNQTSEQQNMKAK